MEKPEKIENSAGGLTEWKPNEDSIKKALEYFGKKPEEIPGDRTGPEADVSKPVSGIVYAETGKKSDTQAEGTDKQSDGRETKSDIGIQIKKRDAAEKMKWEKNWKTAIRNRKDIRSLRKPT